MECPVCFEPNNDTARLCKRCGAPLPKKKPIRGGVVSATDQAGHISPLEASVAPGSDPESIYRFALMVAASSGVITEQTRQLLDARRMALGITEEVAKAIEREVLGTLDAAQKHAAPCLEAPPVSEAPPAPTVPPPPTITPTPEPAPITVQLSSPPPPPPSPALGTTSATVDNFCPNCGSLFTVGTKHCATCGYALQGECPRCHELNVLGMPHCAFCGADIRYAARIARLLKQAQNFKEHYQLPEAVRCLEAVLQIDPEHVLARRTRDNLNTTIEVFQRNRKMGLAAYQAGNLKDAEAYLEEALQIIPTDKEIADLCAKLPNLRRQHEINQLRDKAEQALGEGDPHGAVEILDQALFKDPNNDEFRKMFALAKDAAWQLDVKERLATAQALLRAGEFDKARSECQWVLDRDQDFASAKNLFNQIRTVEGRAADLWRVISELYEQEKWAETLRKLGELLSLNPSHAQAREIKAEIEAMPQRAGALRDAARKAEEDGNDFEAAEALRQLIRITHNPDYQSWLDRIEDRRDRRRHRRQMAKDSTSVGKWILFSPWYLVKGIFLMIIGLLAFIGDLLGASQSTIGRKAISAIGLMAGLLILAGVWDFALYYLIAGDRAHREKDPALFNETNTEEKRAEIRKEIYDLTIKYGNEFGGYWYYGKGNQPSVHFFRLMIMIGGVVAFMAVCAWASNWRSGRKGIRQQKVKRPATRDERSEFY